MANALYGLFVLPESLAPAQRRPVDWWRANPLSSFRQLVALKGVGLLVGVLAFAGTASVLAAGTLLGTIPLAASERGLDVALVGGVPVLATLDTWEPALAVRGLEGLARSIPKNQPADKPALDAALIRLASLDPTLAAIASARAATEFGLHVVAHVVVARLHRARHQLAVVLQVLDLLRRRLDDSARGLLLVRAMMRHPRLP